MNRRRQQLDSFRFNSSRIRAAQDSTVVGRTFGLDRSAEAYASPPRRGGHEQKAGQRLPAAISIAARHHESRASEGDERCELIVPPYGSRPSPPRHRAGRRELQAGADARSRWASPPALPFTAVFPCAWWTRGATLPDGRLHSRRRPSAVTPRPVSAHPRGRAISLNATVKADPAPDF